MPFRVTARGKLFVASLAIVASMAVAGVAYLEPTLRDWLERRIEAELIRHAQTAREFVAMAPKSLDAGYVDVVAKRLGRSTQTRVTLIASDGRVLGDSGVNPSDLSNLESHADRPEVRAAFSAEKGIARRFSTTLGVDMLYVAVPTYPEASAFEGVIRVAMPLSEVDQAAARLRLLLTLAALLAGGVAVLVGGLVSHLSTRALRRLVRQARRVARGERSGLPVVHSTDELSRLAGSFNKLAGEVDRSVLELAGERDRLETILEGMNEAVIAVDAQGVILVANRRAIELFDLVDPLGQPLSEIAGIPKLAELAVTAEADESAGTEFQLLKPEMRDILVRADSLRSSGGAVLVMRDITEMRRLERVRRDFVANVSHELRTPVSVIQANAETLRDGALDDPAAARSFVDALLRNAQRLTHLTDDLLDLSRIESGQLELRIESIELATVVGKALNNARQLADKEGITLVSDVDSGVRARADANSLEQVLSNLLGNAIKYVSRDGRVHVRALCTGEKVRVEVVDDGPGIAAKHQQRIFERFYRVDHGRSRDVGGTGLGLSIVKNLVEAMQGEVGVESTVPNGATFWFLLPSA